MLADVRKNPVSRFRPQFSKSNLATAVKAIGIEYVHLPDLGIPSDLRKEIDYDTIFIWYLEHVHPLSILRNQMANFDEQRIAFMCVELDPTSCHRHCIAQNLEEEGYQIFDL